MGDVGAHPGCLGLFDGALDDGMDDRVDFGYFDILLEMKK